MKLSKMPAIRKRKRISREKMANDLNLPISYIKTLETEDVDIDTISADLLYKIADYLKVDVNDLSESDQTFIEGNKINSISEIVIPKEVDEKEALNLLDELMDKYSPLNVDKFHKLTSEFKYRLKDMKDISKNSWKHLLESLEDPLNEEDNSYNEDDLDEDLILYRARLDAKVVATVYKELRANDLDFSEAIELLEFILNR